jgi:hypothetical protein
LAVNSTQKQKLFVYRVFIQRTEKTFSHLVQAMPLKNSARKKEKYLHCKAINKEAIIITAEAEYISHMKCESDVKK